MTKSTHDLGIITLLGLIILSCVLYSKEEYLLLSIITSLMGFIGGILFLSNLQDFLEVYLTEEKKEYEEKLYKEI